MVGLSEVLFSLNDSMILWWCTQGGPQLTFSSLNLLCAACARAAWLANMTIYITSYIFPNSFIPLLEVPVSLNTVPKPCGWKGKGRLFQKFSSCIIFSHTGMAWWATGQETPVQNLLPTHGIFLHFLCPSINLSSPLFHLDYKTSRLPSALGLKPFTIMSEISVPGDAPMCWHHLERHGLTLCYSEQIASWEWSPDWTNCQMWEWFGGNLVEIRQISARGYSNIPRTLAVAKNISSTLGQFYLHNYTWGGLPVLVLHPGRPGPQWEFLIIPQSRSHKRVNGG